MANILITGASGFLGSVVITRLLPMGHNIIGLDPEPALHSASRHVRDDLSDRKGLSRLLRTERITHVLHCGGVSGPMVLADKPERIMDINVVGSLNLLNASIDSGVTTFLYCSSVSAIGNFYEQNPIGDNYPLNPSTTYGCSKAAIDMVLRGLWQRIPLDLCSLRFTSIYGPGRQTDFIVDDIVGAVVRGEPYTAEAVTDWPYIYIDDAADAAVAACFSAQRKQLFYYIAYPQQVSVRQLAAAAESSAGKPARITISSNITPASRGPLDISAARRDFGFTPKIGHQEGIRRMVVDMLAKYT